MSNIGSKTPEIRGNTLRVYLYTLKHSPCELRDIQHALNFSTPSLASYHLSRLMRAGYVNQDESGRYLAVKDVSGEILEGYTRIGTNIVPQLFFLSLLFSLLVGFFSFEALDRNSYVPYLALAAIGTVALLWFETFRLWKKLVTWN
ncbi:MAG: helix-turn-helix domain-containing protein [Nitrososphaerales archaeon]